MPLIKVSPYRNVPDDVTSWSTRDILFYYSNKLKELTGSHLNIPPVAWRGFMSRIKGFKKKLGLSNQEYKSFIDRVFDEMFRRKSYVPAFGAIVSEKVFNLLKNVSQKSFDNASFIALRDELYKNVLLFKKVL